MVFDKSPLMSTYLLCWVVGEFDYIQAVTKGGCLVCMCILYVCSSCIVLSIHCRRCAHHLTPYHIPYTILHYAIPI
ncbi:hypothetical protein EON63_03830 [archaeon]|nr:MAG: hypothetical protein EON63_03830 [archaeon]